MDLSIVISLYNEEESIPELLSWIERALASQKLAYEIILVDDGSTENMSIVQNLIDNLILFFHVNVLLIPHNKSQGFVLSNNEALLQAHGELAVLLNSDVLVLPGWITALLHTMDDSTHGKVGMVGPIMLNGHGSIMEAGGYIFQSGQPFNAARGYLPLKLSLLHTRQVDYISAACILIRRTLFLQLGLFDLQYTPAYYEDADAALILRAHGYKILLQPFAVVIHYEGSSYGNSDRKDIINIVNR